ncbi:MAG TPA: thioredoxin family protein [Candidatus Dormibacteraeota bacterium]|nr:thioredoxin family protein [Candidatus Dormibacteraeota bacterium]
MSFEVQAVAIGIAGATVGLTAVAARVTSWQARRRAVEEVGTSAGEPYILYFTTRECSICKTHQEPALRKLEATVRRIDAIAEADLARRYSIYTVPTTVVVRGDGTTSEVNYGYAAADKLSRQLAAAGATSAA